MDLVLEFCDAKFLTPYVYPTSWPEDDIWRQFISLFVITNGGGVLMYLGFATLSWYFIYDKTHLEHPLILENQVQKEIMYTLKAIPFMGFLTALCFLAEVRGYSKLYDNVADHPQGWFYIVLSIVTFMMFTDCLIYWAHRWLHHRLIYKYIHKDHHKWIVTTPYASHAFHPIDGFTQSLPYHIYVFLFPMHKLVYLTLYIFVNIWTVSIHDGDFRIPKFLEPFINGSAHHTDHHLYYNYNHGQYFTLWDRLGGTYRYPSSLEGRGPLVTIAKKKQEKMKNGSAREDNGIKQE